MFYTLSQELLNKYWGLKKANFFLTPEDSFNGEFWGDEEEQDTENFLNDDN